MADTKTKIEAFKKLVEFINVTGELWQYDPLKESGGLHLKLARELKYVLKNGRFQNSKEKQEGLNLALEVMVNASSHSPMTFGHLNLERNLIRLILDAGADPNFTKQYYQKVFDWFIYNDKAYGALEIAKQKEFTTPGTPEVVFSMLTKRLERAKEKDLSQEPETAPQHYSDQKELVRVLFQKGIYPMDRKIFNRLVPFVLEDDPEFFTRKKQQAMTSLAKAETPFQIYKALKTTGKE